MGLLEVLPVASYRVSNLQRCSSNSIRIFWDFIVFESAEVVFIPITCFFCSFVPFQMKRIRVFHVEDYKIMRDGIRHLLSLNPDIEIVGEAPNGEGLMKALSVTPTDVLILDIYLDAMEDLTTLNGFQICREVRQQYPNIKIVAHSVYDDADRVATILNAGALGFVSKKSGFEELFRAVKTVYAGEKFICPETAG
jgi:DNA-binding NarL/FixJ family response regulator